LLCLAMHKSRTVFNAASENVASAGILHAPARAKRGAAGKEAVRSAATPRNSPKASGKSAFRRKVDI